jgi:hypothetical protein
MSLDNGNEIEIEASKLNRIGIANDPERVEGIYMRFTDQEQVRVEQFEVTPSRPISVRVDTDALGLADTGNDEWRFDARTLTGLMVLDERAEVVALSTMEPRSIEPMGDRIWTQRPSRINENASHPALMGLDLHSPIRVTYELPENASRFACEFEAPIEQWTDCIARVIVRTYNGQRQLAEHRLNQHNNNIDINLQRPGNAQSLVIEIDPGEQGPIQDRVLLLRPRLLVSN